MHPVFWYYSLNEFFFLRYADCARGEPIQSIALGML
jgi:hypothetical protein